MMIVCYLVLKEQTFKKNSLVAMAKRSHPFPYRTRKLSSLAPMVVGGSPPVRVGRCQAIPLIESIWGFYLVFTRTLYLHREKSL